MDANTLLDFDPTDDLDLSPFTFDPTCSRVSTRLPDEDLRQLPEYWGHTDLDPVLYTVTSAEVYEEVR